MAITRRTLLTASVESGATPVGDTPAQFAAVVMAEVEKWKHVAAVASVQVD